MGEALERVYETGQSLVLTRLDLLVAELRVLTRHVVLGVLAALVLLGGVSWLSFALYRQLELHLSGASAAAVVGVVELTVGAALWLFLRRRVETEEEPS